MSCPGCFASANYALNQWNELNVFVGDGAVPIDNNISEREMKRIVLNRNYVECAIMRSEARVHRRQNRWRKVMLVIRIIDNSA